MPILAAAAVVLAAGAALAVRARRQDRNELAAGRVVTVPRAQQAQFKLPDGTLVLLGSGSTLHYPSDFDATSREVRLEGEAYFTVEHDGRRPFRVRAGELVATDLGTEFLVRAYPEEAHARVVVRSGEVAVRSAAAPKRGQEGPVVRPGELGRLNPSGEPVVEQADTAAYFAWTSMARRYARRCLSCRGGTTSTSDWPIRRLALSPSAAPSTAHSPTIVWSCSLRRSVFVRRGAVGW